MASKRYVVWDEQSQVVTPSGRVFSAEEWFEMYPMARLDSIDLVLSGGVVNGAICYVYQEMIDRYDEVLDFSNCESKQECLDIIEAYEKELEKTQEKEVEIITPEERIAAALEAQVMMAMDDVE